MLQRGTRPADGRLPLLDQRRDRRSQLGALPVLQQLQPRVRVCALRDVEQQAVAVELDVRPSGSLDDLEPVAHAPDVVGLAA